MFRAPATRDRHAGPDVRGRCWTRRQPCRLRNAAAGIVVGKLGAAVVTFTELFGERRAAWEMQQ